MANTSKLTKIVYPYVLKEVSEIIGQKLKEKKILINTKGKVFNGVSAEEDTIITIFTNSGYTKSGKLPSAKISNIYAKCYLMNLTNAKRKILVFTNEEFYKLINDNYKELLMGFELLHVELPDELKAITDEVISNASKEIKI